MKILKKRGAKILYYESLVGCSTETNTKIHKQLTLTLTKINISPENRLSQRGK